MRNSGKKFISLAISEPHAGSDVQGITTSATLSEDGKYWIVSGMKKWITKFVLLLFSLSRAARRFLFLRNSLTLACLRSGHFSDYFMTAVRTGPKSLTMMLIERDADTVDTRKIKTSYSPSAGTAYVFFEKTRVPVENVLGGEGNGLKVILSNCAFARLFLLVEHRQLTLSLSRSQPRALGNQLPHRALLASRL
jgi:alkylation response protein AidB-like acyl-CoA dehydrogenase